MKFSLVLAVYNAGRYLRQCLDSVRSQTSIDWQCICVDDGSTDESGALLDEYSRIDGRFVVLHQENAGANAARNKALSMARGEWVTFLDADDLLSVGWLEEAAKLVEAHHPDAVRLGYEFAVEPPLSFLYRKGSGICRVYENGAATRYCWNTFFPWGFLWATFVRRELVDGLSFKPDIRCKEDSVWLVEAAPHIRKIAVGTFKGYFYRSNPMSLSRRRRTARNSISYLNALAGIWKDQRMYARECGLEDVLKTNLRASAENDVVEWIVMRSDKSGAREVRSEFAVLSHACGWRHCRGTRLRYSVPLWLWRMTGCALFVLWTHNVFAFAGRAIRRVACLIKVHGDARRRLLKRW